MIRVTRGKEPRGLRLVRKRHLASATSQYDTTGSVSAGTLTGYGSKATKHALFEAQHKKCAWCERRADFSSGPVEHYRPKGGAWRHDRGSPPVVDRDHYWWLTWSWSNLLFSCPRCNDQGHKANFFPLAAGTPELPLPARPIPDPLPATFFDVASEHPLLLDPADPVVDPLDHIRWKPVDNTFARRLWTWSPHGLTERGRKTIEILKLDELADEVGDHLRARILPPVEHIVDLVYQGRAAEAHGVWGQIAKDNLAPTSALSAASYDALELWVPAAFRQQHQLAPLRRPG